WFPVWNGHTAVVKLLLEGGADLKKDRDMLLKGLGGKPLLPEIKKLLQNPPKARNMSTVPKRAAATKPVAVAAAPSKSDPAPSPKPSKATMSTPPGPDAGLAAGQAKGTFTMNGKATPLTHAYAIAEPGAFDKKKEDIRVILSNRELTKTNVEEWSDRMRLVDEGLECVEIVFNAEGNIISGEFRHKAKSFSSTGRHVFDKSVLNAQMVAGRLSAPEDEFFGTTYAYDAAFKANVIRKEKPKPVSPAAAAAATKSAPGVAYLAYVKALRAGDIPSLTKLVAKERAEMMKAPEFKEQLGLVQALMPKDIKIVDGKEEGATATLTLVGKEDASTSRGTATLVKEDGAWKVQKESWKGGD
ncbi:MAG: DUF4878 domain-containing protein, partial [Acidobacteria bacterium]|nr:DUF4878 domain-containing protein [Acidobacteriota bacterium]